MARGAPDIYDLDPAARKLLHLDTFRSKFDVNDFVQGLSAANIASTARNSSDDALDPKPYIRTFEAALSRLRDLRVTVDNDTKGMEKDVHDAETQFSRRNAQLEAAFRDVNTSFSGLQNRISDVGKTVTTIGMQLPANLCSLRSSANSLTGGQLEAIEKQRQRAIDARDLFTYYLEFLHDGSSEGLDSLESSSEPKSKSQCAIMTRRLLSLSRDLDPEGKVTESIERHGERLEKLFLKAFDKAYRRGNLREMGVNLLPDKN
jgi:exocyst complex component 5